MNSIDNSDWTMMATFADGREFYQLTNGQIVDVFGREVTLETHADCYDDVISADTPNCRIVHFVDCADSQFGGGPLQYLDENTKLDRPSLDSIVLMLH